MGKLKDWVEPILNVGSQVFNAIFGGNQAKRQRKWQEKMMYQQRAWAVEDRDYQNKYNSPLEEMRRLKEAGLNPNLVYDNGGVHSPAASTRGVDAGSWNPYMAQLDLGSAVGSMYDLELKAAQVDNLKAQKDIMREDAVLRAAQVAATLAGTEGTQAGTAKTKAETKNVEAMLQQIFAGIDKTKVETQTGQFDLSMKKELQQISMEAARESLRKMRAETNNTLSRTETERVMRQPNLQKAVAELWYTREAINKTEKEVMKLKQERKNLEHDETLKKLDIEMRKNGITPSDPFYYRILNRVVEDLRKGRQGIEGSIQDYLQGPELERRTTRP